MEAIAFLVEVTSDAIPKIADVLGGRGSVRTSHTVCRSVRCDMIVEEDVNPTIDWC